MRYIVRMTAPGWDGAEYIARGKFGRLGSYCDSVALWATKREARSAIAIYREQWPSLRDVDL